MVERIFNFGEILRTPETVDEFVNIFRQRFDSVLGIRVGRCDLEFDEIFSILVTAFPSAVLIESVLRLTIRCGVRWRYVGIIFCSL